MSVRAIQRLLNILIVLGALALVFVVGYPQYKDSLPSKVRIGVDKSFYSLPFYIAKMDTTRDYFAIEKVEPEFIEINEDPLEGIKEGKYDIATVPWYWLIISPSINGDTIKAFSSIEIKSGRAMDAIIVLPDSKIKRLKDLRGKKLGYLSTDEYLVNLILAKMEEDYGITKITNVPLQVEEIATALTENKVDALYLIDPFRGYMVYQGNKILFESLIPTYLIASLPYGAIVMRKDFIKTENRLAAIRAKNAIEATISYLTRDPEIGKKYIIEMNGWMSDGALTLNIRMPEYHRLSEINLKNVEYLQNELVKGGIGTCGIKPSEFLFVKPDFTR